MRKRLGLPHYDPEEMVRPVFVSRMPNRKVSGAAHKETIRSGKLPQKAVAAYAAAENRREMRDSDFLFPLYAGDLIRIKAKKPIGLQLANKDASGEPELQRKEWMLYYVSAGITTGSITVTTHDRKYQKDSLGLKTLLSIEKYEVDPLGEYHKVHTPEKRQTFR